MEHSWKEKPIVGIFTIKWFCCDRCNLFVTVTSQYFYDPSGALYPDYKDCNLTLVTSVMET